MIKKGFLIVFLFLLIALLTPFPEANSWGFFAHRTINRMAVFTLPTEMVHFYKSHLSYIEAHATDPDKRRYVDAAEAPRHYLDSDHYGLHPFDSIPKKWTDAVKKYGEDSLKAHGIVPWHVEHTLLRLTKAFREENIDLILHYSADLGHYVGDAHVPLHTTANYNGQFTGQEGIHAFWESRIPELKAKDYDYFTGRAEYLEKPLEAIWEAVKTSYSEKDSVLLLEAELSRHFPSDQKYSVETKNKKLVNVYSVAYANAYDELLRHMVERRMRAAIHLVGSMWYTAWVNAGQPDLSRYENKAISDSLRKVHQLDAKNWKHKKVSNPGGHAE
jgi:hypothetical protein